MRVNVVDVEAAMVMGSTGGTESDGPLFHIANAFPSLCHAFLFEVPRRMRPPLRLIAILGAMCRDVENELSLGRPGARVLAGGRWHPPGLPAKWHINRSVSRPSEDCRLRD